jgi:glycosyltransferase involved in cell wall biosynthesis
MKRADVDVVPNGVDTSMFRFRSSEEIPPEKRVLFIGDFKWLQNIDAAENILKHIWPSLSLKLEETKEKTNVKLWLVGKNMPARIKNLARGKNIIVDENNKDDTPNLFRKAYVLLAPIRAGGGTSYKIIEAMASGVGVVTTNLGIEGLEAKNNIHVLASQDEEKMADLVLNLIQDHSLYRKITHNARKLVEEKYDWKIIAQKLNEIYMSCL